MCHFHFFFSQTAGTLQSPEFVHVAIEMNWSSAQTYCRENYIDLASGRKEAEMQEITSLVMEKYWAWTGLFVEPTSDWSDGSGSSFVYWYEEGYSIDLTSAACAAASLQTSGKWLLFPCETKLSVACYSVLKPGEYLVSFSGRQRTLHLPTFFFSFSSRIHIGAW